MKAQHKSQHTSGRRHHKAPRKAPSSRLIIDLPPAPFIHVAVFWDHLFPQYSDTLLYCHCWAKQCLSPLLLLNSVFFMRKLNVITLDWSYNSAENLTIFCVSTISNCIIMIHLKAHLNWVCAKIQIHIKSVISKSELILGVLWYAIGLWDWGFRNASLVKPTSLSLGIYRQLVIWLMFALGQVVCLFYKCS